MINKVGLVIKVRNNKISFITPFFYFTKKYKGLHRKISIIHLKVKNNLFKKGDLIY